MLFAPSSARVQNNKGVKINHTKSTITRREPLQTNARDKNEETLSKCHASIRRNGCDVV